MLIEVLTLLAGIIIVVALAKVVVSKSLSLAAHFGVSGTFIGLTVLSIGTSIPEILGHAVGSLQILTEPALMNTVSGLLIGASTGSDIFQQLFVLAVVGLIGTVLVERKSLIHEMGALILGAVIVLVFSLNGYLSRLEGFVLLGLYVLYLWYLRRIEANEHIIGQNNLTKGEVSGAFLLIIGAFLVMGYATNEVLNASEILVASLPISASFFGVMVLGVASALPELTTAIMAILRGEKGVSSGVLIGSNITNPLFGIGLGAVISEYTVPIVVRMYDLPVKIGSGILLYYLLYKYGSIGKKQATFLLIIFLVYIVVRQVLFPVDSLI